MPLSRTQIIAMIPHGPDMCMLDEVLEWDAQRIRCRANPTRSNNPLQDTGPIRSTLLIEYAAQAAAVHRALAGSGTLDAKPAYLGAIKQVELLQPLVDNRVDIILEAICVMSSESGAIYDIVATQEQPVIRGRLILSRPQ